MKYIKCEKFWSTLAHYHITIILYYCVSLWAICLTHDLSVFERRYFFLISFYALVPNTMPGT